MEIATGAASAALPKLEIVTPGSMPGTPGALPDQMAAPDDMARFQAAMATLPPPGGEAPAAAGAPSQIGAPNGTPGDAILNGLKQMGERFNDTADRINQTLDAVKPGEAIPAADLVRLQMAMTEVTVQQDLTGKVVGKATQHVDTFLKNQ